MMDRCQAAMAGRGGGRGAKRCPPVIRFRPIHWTVEQVEDGRRTMERKYEADGAKAEDGHQGRPGWGGFTNPSHSIILIPYS